MVESVFSSATSTVTPPPATGRPPHDQLVTRAQLGHDIAPWWSVASSEVQFPEREPKDLRPGICVPILETMRIIAKATLRNFWSRYPAAKEPLSAWHRLMQSREFQTPHELKAEFGTVSLLERGFVCFNIGGNKFRLVVHVRYDLGIMFVKHVLTHEEYDALNASGMLIEKRKGG